MTSHNFSRGAIHRLVGLSSIPLLVLLILSVCVSEAIVKQQQQQQQQQPSQPSQQQQARNDDAGQQQPLSGSFSLQQAAATSQSQPQYSSSISVSSSSGGASSSQSAPNTYSGSSSSYASGPSGSQAGSKPTYYDNMAVSANSPEQSYQAAANNVNMALANSGIFSGHGASSSGPSGASSSASPSSANSPSSSASSLNPLHYYYYPAKENQPSQQLKPSSIDSISNQNQFTPLSGSYADQLNSALSSLGASGPDVAASNPDPSYVPQPGSMNENPSIFGGQSNQHQPLNGPQNGHNNGGQHNSYQSPDLNAYPNNLNPTQSSGQQPHGQSSIGSVSFQSNSNGNNDFLGQGPQGSMQQGQQPSNNGPNNNMFNQMGDLYTSNYGSPSISSPVASYMPPNSQAQAGMAQPAISGHDPFGSASQHQASNLFGSASSFIGQQANGNPQANGNSLFKNQAYLNSLLNQQYGQLGGALPGLVDQQSMVTSSSQPGSVTSPAGSGKKFGLSSFIMPMLALAGLSLLIPTMSNIGTAVGRKKRSVDDKATLMERQQQILYESMNGVSQLAKESSIGEYLDKIERYYAIYKNAAENDDCMNRLICEFGDAVKDVTGKSAVITVIEKLVPHWMVGKVQLFKAAAMDRKEGKEKCKKYTCRNDKH